MERLKEKKPGDSLGGKAEPQEAWGRQKRYYADDIEYLIRAAKKLRNLICEVSDMFEKRNRIKPYLEERMESHNYTE